MSATAANLGQGNGGFAGDIFVGTFRELPGLSAGENRGILPDRAGASGFMLVNAMAYALNDYTNPLSDGSTGADLRQRVTVSVDPAVAEARGASSLYRLDCRKGKPTEVQLVRSGDAHTFTVDIDGGAGEFFFWG